MELRRHHLLMQLVGLIPEYSWQTRAENLSCDKALLGRFHYFLPRSFSSTRTTTMGLSISIGLGLLAAWLLAMVTQTRLFRGHGRFRSRKPGPSTFPD